VFKYRFAGRQRWILLGHHGDLTAEQARTKAQSLRGAIADGEDLAKIRDERAAAPTLNQLADRFIEEYAIPHKKSRSVEEDRRNLKLHVRPEFGDVKAADVARQDIRRLHHKMRGTPGAANRTLALLSKMFGLAEDWGLRPQGSNPCRGVKKYRERSRERFLTLDELQRLGAALDGAPDHPSGIAIIRLLALTGCRLSEIAALEWSFVDFELGCLRLPDSKTGPKTVHLGAPALAFLAGLPRFQSRFVFPAARGANRSPGRTRRAGPGYFVGVGYIWQRIRTRAGLEDVRLHDLRHTFGSWSVMGGASLPLTGALLGHRRPATTQRYAHFASTPVQAAADRVAGTIAAALAGTQNTEVIELRRRGAPQ
jgi:integrase